MKSKDVSKTMRIERGQILLETVIALGILVVGVLAVVSLSTIILRNASVSGNRIIAVNLAREGIELTRLVRDTRWLDPDDAWPFGLDNGAYMIDSESGDQLVQASGAPGSVAECGSECDLYLDAMGRYTHAASATPTPFRRLVLIADASGDQTKRVVVEVEWRERGNHLTYHLETHLSNWRDD